MITYILIAFGSGIAGFGFGVVYVFVKAQRARRRLIQNVTAALGAQARRAQEQMTEVALRCGCPECQARILATVADASKESNP